MFDKSAASYYLPSRIEAECSDFGVAIKHPRNVREAIDARQRLLDYLAQQAQDPVELAAHGQIDAALAAIEGARLREVVATNGSVRRAEDLVNGAVTTSADDYLAQVADAVTECADRVNGLAAGFPVTRDDWRDFAVAARAGYADALGTALAEADRLHRYANRLVAPLLTDIRDASDRQRLTTATLFDVPVELRFENARSAQENVDRATGLIHAGGASTVLRVAAGADTPVTLSPATTAEEVYSRLDRLHQTVRWAQSAEAVEEFREVTRVN
ncbi:hypothetical protein [Gordonia polyisoprenivorans]|uniref:hypothetical protein n=1 Tax=Gordonia polyisoprenivorans TaxID=84595 RepID=UPI0005B7B870|nr:hypothetical protein [Gordonia polyisoprenivorans]